MARPSCTCVSATAAWAWCGLCRLRRCSLRRLKRPLMLLRRHVPWERAWGLLGLSLLASLLLPGAPLHGLVLLTEASERQRLVGENELRLQHSLKVLEAYRRGLGSQGQEDHPLRRGRLDLRQEGDPDQNVREDLHQGRLEDAVLFGHHPGSDRNLGPPTPATDDVITGSDDVDVRAERRGPGGFYPTGQLADGRPVQVAVTVLTTTRGRRLTPQGRAATNYSTQYLTQSVAHLLELLQEGGLQRSYSLTICNVDEHPEMFLEARQLEDLLPFIRRYGNPDSRGNPESRGNGEGGTEDDAVTAEELTTKDDGLRHLVIWEKLKADYIFCLERSVDSGALYHLLVEDDAIAHAHLFRVVERVIERVLEGAGREGGGRAGSTAYVKLYHPRRLLGYLSLEPERLPELLSLAALLGAGLTFLLSFCPSSQTRGRRAQPRQKQTPAHQHRGGSSQPGMKKTGEKSLFHKLDPSSPPHPPPPPPPASSAEPSGPRGDHPLPAGGQQLLRCWLGWSLVVGALALAVGRPNLLEGRRLSPQLYLVGPAPSCCIPAVLYTRDGAAGLARFLSNVTCTARLSTDIRMDEWRWAPGGEVRALMVQPNLFSHVGLVSSLRTQEVSPLIIP